MDEKEMLTPVENEDEIVELTDDQGRVLKFYHIATIDYKKEWYAFFQPAENLEGVDPDEVVIFKISGEEDEEVLLPVEDDKLLEEVYNEFIRVCEEDDDCDCDDDDCDCGCHHKE